MLGTLPKLALLRPQLARLPDFDLSRFDRLELYALALAHTHTRPRRASRSPEIAELAQQAAKLRATLLADATALAKRDLLDAKALKSLKGAVGYRNLAFDLGALSNLIRQALPTLHGKTAATENELNRARSLADQLLTAVGERRSQASVQPEAALTRQKAFTLFTRAYDQVRRAVSYLRWDDGDANDFAPSLYERRHTKKNPKRAPESVHISAPAPQPNNTAQPSAAGPSVPSIEPPPSTHPGDPLPQRKQRFPQRRGGFAHGLRPLRPAPS